MSLLSSVNAGQSDRLMEGIINPMLQREYGGTPPGVTPMLRPELQQYSALSTEVLHPKYHNTHTIVLSLRGNVFIFNKHTVCLDGLF